MTRSCDTKPREVSAGHVFIPADITQAGCRRVLGFRAEGLAC